jgi:hypothetical protein
MSALYQALLVNALVLVAVLEADLGPHRKLGVFRVLRPILLAGGIVPIYLKSLATHGAGLTLEILGVIAGVVVGLIAAALITVYRSPRTGKLVSRAGAGYAVLWVLLAGARSLFSYGSVHWFGAQLGRWMFDHRVTAGALTDALILMAVATVITRTAGLLARARAAAARPIAAEVPSGEAVTVANP